MYFPFLRKKESTKGKTFLAKNCVFRGEGFVKVLSASQGTGLYEAGTLMESRKGLLERKKLYLLTVSSRREITRKRRHPSSLPPEGEGGPPQVGDEVDRSFPF